MANQFVTTTHHIFEREVGKPTIVEVKYDIDTISSIKELCVLVPITMEELKNLRKSNRASLIYKKGDKLYAFSSEDLKERRFKPSQDNFLLPEGGPCLCSQNCEHLLDGSCPKMRDYYPMKICRKYKFLYVGIERFLFIKEGFEVFNTNLSDCIIALTCTGYKKATPQKKPTLKELMKAHDVISEYFQAGDELDHVFKRG